QHWQVPFGMNITHLKDNPFWKEDLLDRKAALVESNPDYDRIGVWQGGDNSLFNKWRSEKVSCMIDNRCYFSTWQRILIVKRIKAPKERVPVSLDRYGNTGGISIPLTLCDKYGTEKAGTVHALMSGFGIGLSWGVFSAAIDTERVYPVIQTSHCYTEGRFEPGKY
ncbi:MAG: 3-oxoacyl-[acyl-carrier-protein] synthase III C-terminal domain-containing protein, partial [Acutalibacteraceae bacterium]|nr:3-oxoacyl-[acyl-carrier-protein] synthase III C-terminal domain-containing protein [Acutalibacteraceae bacterium]